MAELSISQIADYNNREAFVRSRNQSAASAATFLDSVKSDTSYAKLETAGLSDSYSLLSGLYSRLEMVEDNLGQMLSYAKAGQTARTENERDEYIGLLRSLSGGIDDIVDATVWNDTKIIDGRSIELNLSQSGNGASETLSLGSYYSSDDDGLDLTTQPAAGVGTIYYDYYSSYRNSQAGVIGLDISSVSSSEVASNQLELESGNYQLEISYEGPSSSVILKSSDGGYINRIDNVDLSGSGQEIVDMEVGISISIDKEQYLLSVDKYDYENEGPVSLYANLYWDQTYEHQLEQDEWEEFSEQNVSVNYQSNLKDGRGGELSFDNIRITGVDDDVTGFASGNYSLKVNYYGESSSVEIRGSDGKLAYLNYGVDLSGTDPVDIDTGLGIAFTIQNNGFDGTGKLTANLSYEADGNNNDTFDFSSYASKIEEAMEKVNGDLVQVAELINRAYTMNQYQVGNFGTNGNTTAGGQATSLITGAAGSNSIFSAANGILSATAEDLFTNAAASISAQSEMVYAHYLA